MRLAGIGPAQQPFSIGPSSIKPLMGRLNHTTRSKPPYSNYILHLINFYIFPLSIDFMVERQVRWNRFIDKGEQTRLRYRYVFAIVNEPREIGIIERKLLEELAPVDDHRLICDWQIPTSDGSHCSLHCRVFAFSSGTGRIEHPERIYDSKRFYYDRRFYDVDEVRLSSHLRELTGVD